MLSFLYGKYFAYKAFEKLHKISIKGMNYGFDGGISKSGELSLIRNLALKSKDEFLIIFDVGANRGDYTNALCQEIRNNFIIHAFEPSVKTFEQYLQNTSVYAHQIKANNLGISDKEDNAELFLDKIGSGMGSLYKRNLGYKDISFEISERIKLTTLDKYCELNNIDRIHFLKLDIEGNELNALKGASKIIEEDRINMIQFEFGGCNIDSKTYFKDFYDLLTPQFTIYRLLKDTIVPITAYSELLEIFITSNFVAIKND